MKKRLIIIRGAVVFLFLSTSVQAWNDLGHKVVARIAWENMTPQARAKVVALLMAAPPDADLSGLFPDNTRPLPVREQEFFLRASTWADIVRDGEFPARRDKYHKSTWHFMNFFWEQPDPKSRPRDRTDLKPAAEYVMERLQHFESFIGDTTQDRSQRAIALAWVLHLVGDIHQPLHCSARVTSTELQGDRGGNLFLLDTTGTNIRNLHSYWDGILSLACTKTAAESDETYINRIAQTVLTHHPKTKVRSRFKLGEIEAWSKEGLDCAKRSVYPSWLHRYETPPKKYRKRAYRAAEPAIALAGYRLAEMLNRLLVL